MLRRTTPNGKGLVGSWAGAVLALWLTGCIDPTQAAAPAASSTPETETDVAVLLNNTTVHAHRNHLVALKGDGETAWDLTLPNGDVVIAPVAVGLNSVTYVRGAKGLHAALPEGKWLWSVPLEGRSFLKTRAADGPATLSDSTVALVVGDDIVRFDLNGKIRWRLTLPEGHVSRRPVPGTDGSLVVATTAGLYALSPEGQVLWRRVLAQ